MTTSSSIKVKARRLQVRCELVSGLVFIS
jgi:hypothetical protein